uniref:Cystatin domain-containing protein n=1 Tax=Strongyloides stercoralis TaxID=6248 RepID=A0A0K0EEY0_STRER
MNHFNIFLLILATVFLISEIVFAAPKVNLHDWKMKSCDSRKLMRMGFDLAKSKNNGTKYYEVYFLAVKDCNGHELACPLKLHASVTSYLDRKKKPLIKIEKTNSKAE